MKKVIVTGANGFVGSHLVRELLENNIEVIAIVRSKDSNLDNLPEQGKLRIIYCELSEISQLPDMISDNDIDTFYHFAWSGSSGNARIDERLQMQNAQWTIDSVRAAKQIGCSRFVGAGSIMERETIAAVYTGENKPGLGYIYGSGKLTAHCISKSVAASIGIEHIWGIITNAYGPGELSPRFINTTLRKIINEESLEFTSATQNYDFIYITDVAKAFYKIGELGKAFSSYIIGSSQAKPLKELIFELKEELAKNSNLTFGDVPFTGINMSLDEFSTKSIEMDTGFKSEITFKVGVKNTMDWLKKLEG